MKRPRRELTERQRKYLAAGSIAVFLLFFALVFWFVGRPMVRLASQPERFRQWVDGMGPWSRLAFVGMMALQIFVAVIPGEPLELGAGYAFGSLQGTALCLLGAALGSVLVVLFVRCFGARAVEIFFPREKELVQITVSYLPPSLPPIKKNPQYKCCYCLFAHISHLFLLNKIPQLDNLF